MLIPTCCKVKYNLSKYQFHFLILRQQENFMNRIFLYFIRWILVRNTVVLMLVLGTETEWNIRVVQKNQNAELRAGSLSGDARLVTDIKYITKNIYKSIQATQIEFLYFLYIAL